MLSGGISVIIRNLGFAFLVTVTGPAYSIAECGQVLAWLALTFAPSVFPGATGDIFATPYLTRMKDSNSLANLGSLEQEEPYGKASGWRRVMHLSKPEQNAIAFQISVQESLPAIPSSIQTTWWTVLRQKFSVNRICRGYPNIRRSNKSPGLEISYSVLLGLVGRDSKTANSPDFAQVVGENVTLEFVDKEDDIYYWHEAPSARRLRCTSHWLPRTFRNIFPQDMKKSRHFLLECKTLDLPQSDCKFHVSNSRLVALYSFSTARKGASVGSDSEGMSIDPDMLSMSSSTEAGAQPNERTLGFRIFNEVLRRLVSFALASLTSPTIIPTTGNTEDAVNQSPPITSSFQKTKRTPARPGARKHSRLGHSDSNENEEEEDEDQRPEKMAKKNHCDVMSRPQLLACPFYKLSPRKHRQCFTKKLDTISHMKTHLYRRHATDFYCQKCKTIFNDDQALHEHLQGTCSFSLAQLDGITIRQKSLLGKRTRGSVEQKWFTVWDILFPGKPRPNSIYIHMDQQEVVVRVQELLLSRGPNFLGDVLREAGSVLRPDVSREQVTEVLRDGITSLFQRFELESLWDSASYVSASSNSQGSTYHRSSNPPSSLTPDLESDSGIGISSRSAGPHLLPRRGDWPFSFEPPSQMMEMNSRWPGSRSAVT